MKSEEWVRVDMMRNFLNAKLGDLSGGTCSKDQQNTGALGSSRLTFQLSY
jgi:hypothetical protein